MSETSSATFSPRIVAFLCNWCSYSASDLAGTSRIKYAPQVRMIRVMCSGRVDPTFVLKAFALGADGVMIAGCHPGDCHYIEQNYKTLRRYHLLRRMLQQIGIEQERLRLVWASASEGPQLAQAINDFVAQIRQLGPLGWSQHWQEDGQRQAALEAIVQEHASAMEVPIE
ncbi:MAG: hydrogenase iron-sulfur subunit [Thermoguttaceae bacterium]|nr:hydrogenase iron-sulfur subunit [Thermoguttaceae bacterium]MDW8039514.1 hydrogenase iron-sulfur subunit [Thermoguttaceae bacterium]